MPVKPTIHILGAGALGSLWATKLSVKNHVVLLIKSDKKNHQFQFKEQDHSTTIILPSEPSNNPKTPIDTLLVFTKSYDTLLALSNLKDHLSPHCRIVLFQNGMGSQQDTCKLLPDLSIYAASTTEGANRPDSGTVVYAGSGQTQVGAIAKGRILTSCDKLVELLSSSGLKVSVTEDIWQKLWIKLAINCAINPFTALLDCKNGELIDHQLFQSSITPLCNELSTAMRLNNIDMSAEDIRSRVDTVMKNTSSNVSSMLQDVRSGKQTEIDYINGYIEKVAKQQKLNLPTNLKLFQEVSRKFNH